MPDLYVMPNAAPCRASMLTAKAVGIEMNLKVIDVLAEDQMKPEFIAINPQHCTPTLVDGDFTLWESRAICSYLSSKYGKDDSLYPSDVRTRARIDHLMYFDMGTLYFLFRDYLHPVLFFGAVKNDQEKLGKIQEALGWLNGFLEGHDYAVGNNITVADHSLVATVSTIEAASKYVAGIDLNKHSNVVAWLARCKANMPGYMEANDQGVQEFGKMVKEKLGFA